MYHYRNHFGGYLYIGNARGYRTAMFAKSGSTSFPTRRFASSAMAAQTCDGVR